MIRGRKDHNNRWVINDECYINKSDCIFYNLFNPAGC